MLAFEQAKASLINSWDYVVICLGALCGATVLIQVGFIFVSAWLIPDPSPTAVLVHNEDNFGFALPIIMVLPLFGSTFVVLERVLKKRGKSDYPVSSILFLWVWTGLVTSMTNMTLITSCFLRPITFVDLPQEMLVVREIYGLPKGFEDRQIPFVEIQTIKGTFRPSHISEGVPVSYRYQILAVTKNRQELVVSRGHEQPAVLITEPDPETAALAASIAARSGAELVLTSKVVW